jgi:uncharacterized protein YmfQ (DUF2313 family)
MTDKHVRRGGEDYAEALASLLPVGPAWPREFDSILMQLVAGVAMVWGDVDDRAADLLETESDPRKTVELLPDWERAFGLPDDCLSEPLTIRDRQIALVARMTMLGGQSRAFLIAVAAAIGYTITIQEFAPFMAGVSQAGDTRPVGEDFFRWYIGPPEMRFYWTIHISGARLTWFRSAQGEAGVDPHLRIGLATDLECILRRYKPAHTEIIFDYSDAGISDPMAGTP